MTPSPVITSHPSRRIEPSTAGAAPISHTAPPSVIDAALSPPASRSAERDRQLLNAAVEAGAGGQALSVLEHVDIQGLDAHDRVRYLQAVTACSAWLEAFQAMAVAAVCGPSGGWVTDEIEERAANDVQELAGGTTSTRDRERLTQQARDEAWEVRERAVTLEVSMAMRVSPRTAGRRIDGARFLLESLRPAVHEALAGRWGYGHLRVAEKELANVPAPLRELVFTDVLPYAAIDHPRRLTDRIRKSLARRDASGSAERMHERAQQRDVTLWNLTDGQARLAVTGPYQTVTEMHRCLTDLARARQRVLESATEVSARPGGAAAPPSVDSPAANDRRLGALRFDAVSEAVRRLVADMDSARSPGAEESAAVHSTAHTPSGNLAESASAASAAGDPWTGPRAHGPGSRPAPQAAIIVDLATALHLADEPGFLPGYGWVPAPIAREILADCERWRRWLVDDKARKLIEAGTTRYRPSQALRDLITGRDLTCTADTCTRPASEAQIDHAIDFDGTNTTPDNLHGVCGPDHLVITAGHFVIDSDSDGRLTWVSTSSGHAYPSYPDLLHETPTPRAEQG